MKTLYMVIVKHVPGTTKETYSICPLDDQRNLTTEFEELAQYKALENKACNPVCDYFVVQALTSAEVNPLPKYHMVPCDVR